MDNINLNWLKIFMVVATSNSFLDASKKLYISQPAVSKSISSLEKALNINLFYRGNKGISLTPKGKQLFDYVSKASNLLDAAGRMIVKDNNLNSGELVIGAQSHIARYFLLEKIEVFRKKYNKVNIKIIDLSTRDLLEALENHVVDFVIDSSPIDTIYNNTIIKQIAYLDTSFIKSPKNKAIIKNPEDLMKQDVILPLSRSSLRKTLEKHLKEDNIIINPTLEFETEELIIESVKRNLGVGFVVKNAVKNDIKDGNIEIIELNYYLPKVEINIVYVENYLSPLAKLFIDSQIEIKRGNNENSN